MKKCLPILLIATLLLGCGESMDTPGVSMGTIPDSEVALVKEVETEPTEVPTSNVLSRTKVENYSIDLLMRNFDSAEEYFRAVLGYFYYDVDLFDLDFTQHRKLTIFLDRYKFLPVEEDSFYDDNLKNLLLYAYFDRPYTEIIELYYCGDNSCITVLTEDNEVYRYVNITTNDNNFVNMFCYFMCDYDTYLEDVEVRHYV